MDCFFQPKRNQKNSPQTLKSGLEFLLRKSYGIELQEIVALAGQRRCIVVRSIRLVVVSSGGSICRCPSFFGCQQVGFRSGRRGSIGVVFLIAGERKTQGEGQKVKKTGFHVVENK